MPASPMPGATENARAATARRLAIYKAGKIVAGGVEAPLGGEIRYDFRQGNASPAKALAKTSSFRNSKSPPQERHFLPGAGAGVSVPEMR